MLSSWDSRQDKQILFNSLMASKQTNQLDMEFSICPFQALSSEGEKKLTHQSWQIKQAQNSPTGRRSMTIAMKSVTNQNGLTGRKSETMGECSSTAGAEDSSSACCEVIQLLQWHLPLLRYMSSNLVEWSYCISLHTDEPMSFLHCPGTACFYFLCLFYYITVLSALAASSRLTSRTVKTNRCVGSCSDRDTSVTNVS